jgi:formate dehydrogenase maturation protein FdhE
MSRKGQDAPGQARLFAEHAPICPRCNGIGSVYVLVTLPNGNPGARLDPCPLCQPKREDDPR